MKITLISVKSYNNYDIKEELWEYSPKEEPSRMVSAYSKQGDYIGNPKRAYRLVNKYGITHFQSIYENSNVVSIGYSHLNKKWYGWSHRALFGFKPGSKCKKGDCHYKPKNKKDFKEDCIRFWSEPSHLNITGKFTKTGVQVDWTYDDKIPNKKLRGTLGEQYCEYPKEWGKGEWTAKNWDDAKQMAIDFSEGVS